MPVFLYRCPATDLRVQGWLPDEGGNGGNGEISEAVACTACGQVHFVDPRSGRTLGVAEE